MNRRLVILSSFLVFCLSMGGLLNAQEQYGHIRGKVLDENEEPLPGATIVLECPQYGNHSRISSSVGAFRFLNLAPSTYTLKCELSGFKVYVEKDIIIRVGNNFDFSVVLEQAKLAEEVFVVAKSPIVDSKKTGTSFNVTELMLQEVPSSRDPWAILKQTPGIYIYGENVAGIDSGNQSNWTSKGTCTKYFGNFNLDGVNVTDNTPAGDSSRFYDFDSLEEIQIVTTGQDASIKTGGVSINMVTRRGGNKPEFLARFFLTNDKLQSDNRPQELIDLDYVGNQINTLTDYGFQAGGPILRDKIWFWLGYGVQDVRLLSIDGYPNDTKIESINAKLNFQLSPKDRAELVFMYNNRTVFNTNVGPLRPPEATYNQTNNGMPFVKLQYERMFSSVFLMTFKLAYSWGWFGKDPNGGLDTQAGWDLYTGIVSGTAEYQRTHRPSYNAQVDGNYFLENFLGGNHEFKYGMEYRLAKNYGDHIWPGGVRKRYYNEQPYQAFLHRCLYDRVGDRISLYFNDAYSRGRLSITLGLRVDRENFWNKEIEIPAHPIAPEIMPGFTLSKIDPGVILWSFSPRLGLTFDLTGDGKTILRANLARYGWWPDDLASLLSVSEENTARYDWDDLNGDDLVSTDELVGYPYNGLITYSGYNPFDPTNPVSPYAIADDLSTGLTDEFLVGVEREIFKDFSVSANITLRRFHSWNWWVAFNKETGQKDSFEDWQGPFEGSMTIDGTIYNYNYWVPKTHQFDLPNRILESCPNWHSNYAGLEIIATKRLSRRWMFNASFTLQETIDHYKEGSYTDPTNIENLDGGSSFMDSRWMAKLSFLYQLPWGINVSGFAYAREGAPNTPWIRAYTPERRDYGLGRFSIIFVEKNGKTRFPNFYNFDLGLSKGVVLGRHGKITLRLDVFNVFNFNHTLKTISRLDSPRYGEINSILNPRVIRFGIRYRF